MTTLDRIAQIKKSLCSDFQKLDRIVNKVKKRKKIYKKLLPFCGYIIFLTKN